LKTLRILWLSRSDTIDAQIETCIWVWTWVREIVKRYSAHAYEILGWDYNPKEYNFSSSLVLVWTDYKPNIPGVNKTDVTFMNNSYAWYSFEHSFLEKRWYTNSVAKTYYIGCVYIDEWALHKTIWEIWERDFKVLEKSLGAVFALMNHDATTHRFWVAIPVNKIWGNELLQNQLWMEAWIEKWKNGMKKYNPQEVASAMFHRDMFEEIDELWIPLKDFIIKQAYIYCSIIDNIQDWDVKAYWNKVLNYALLSLLNPEGPEVWTLQLLYPELKFKHTKWSELIHRKNLNCSIIWVNWEKKWTIPLRDIRSNMMPFYQKQLPSIQKHLAQLLEWQFEST